MAAERSMDRLIEELRAKRARAGTRGWRRPTGEAETDRVSSPPASELMRLVDAGSFEEIWSLRATSPDAIRHGGQGNTRPMAWSPARRPSMDVWFIWRARTSRSSGGSAGEIHSYKVADVMDLALQTGSPFIFINDSGGARVQEGIDSLSGYGRVFYHERDALGRRPADLPDLRSVCRRRGLLAGTDRLYHPRRGRPKCSSRARRSSSKSRASRSRPKPWAVAEAHMAHSGVIHFVAEDDDEAIYICRAPAQLPAVEQSRRSAAHSVATTTSSPIPIQRDRARASRSKVTTCATSSAGIVDGATSWKSRPVTP